MQLVQADVAERREASERKDKRGLDPRSLVFDDELMDRAKLA